MNPLNLKAPKSNGTVILQYLKGSKQMGLRLWNVMTPVKGYKTGPDAGYPTFSLPTLQEKGLLNDKI
jgi:hypothetical protein